MSDFNLVIATPSTGMCKSAYAYSLANMVAYFAQVKVLPEPGRQSLDLMMIEGSGISSNRERMVIDALAKPAMTHLLFIDEDMGFNPDVMHTLARRRQHIVGCNYRMRVPPADFTALKADKSGRIQMSAEMTGLEECWYMGFGMTLISREALEAVEPPRFPIFFKPDMSGYTTEDLPFYEQARQKGYVAYCDHDASKAVWHNGSIAYCWNEDYRDMNQGLRRN